jgi:UTP--glucose-1-phosphate uridylyltransferase
MVEKPSQSDLKELFNNEIHIENKPTLMGIIGRYILTPDIFDILRKTKSSKGKEIQITDALNIQAKQGNVIAYKFKGTRFDCGSIEGYLKATNHFAKKLGVF